MTRLLRLIFVVVVAVPLALSAQVRIMPASAVNGAGQVPGGTLVIGPATSNGVLLTNSANQTLRVRLGDNSADGDLVARTITATSNYIVGSGTVANSGDIRLANSASILWRNIGNSANIGWRVTGADVLSGDAGSVFPSGYQFYTAASQGFNISSTGHLLTGTDNAYDIGASGATRPRNGYFGGAVSATGFSATSYLETASAGGFIFNGRSVVRSPANGLLNLTNNAEGAGVGLDFATDGTLRIRNRGQSANAALIASTGSFTGAIDIANTVGAAVAVASTHKVTIVIGGVTYYLLATNVP